MSGATASSTKDLAIQLSKALACENISGFIKSSLSEVSSGSVAGQNPLFYFGSRNDSLWTMRSSSSVVDIIKDRGGTRLPKVGPLRPNEMEYPSLVEQTDSIHTRQLPKQDANLEACVEVSYCTSEHKVPSNFNPAPGREAGSSSEEL